jgi:UDP-N-acetylglucosamine 2-epimerase (non-hydrolysing)
MCVAGARPNFLKIGPLMDAFARLSSVSASLVHTGQHYDRNMSESFFDELGIPDPVVNLGVGSGTHAAQTAAIIERFEPVVLKYRPDVVIVVGDVNSTIACGMVAAKLGIRLAHVEAGLRSFDRTMPEEINRVLTDAIADLLFCSEQSGVDNLKTEGVSAEKIHLVGNVMIDSLVRHRDKAEKSTVLNRLDLKAGGYAVLTLHRPSNVDELGVFGGVLDALDVIQREIPIVFPVHPRTRASMESSSLGERIAKMPGLRVIDPVGYLDFMRLMMSARAVLTDSGGVQEETTFLGIPCLTLRENTERPVTVEMGTNTIVGRNPDKIVAAFRKISGDEKLESKIPPLWDGHAAERIASIVAACRTSSSKLLL